MAKNPTPKQLEARAKFTAAAKQRSVKKMFKPSNADARQASTTPAYRTRKRI